MIYRQTLYEENENYYFTILLVAMTVTQEVAFSFCPKFLGDDEWYFVILHVLTQV